MRTGVASLALACTTILFTSALHAAARNEMRADDLLRAIRHNDTASVRALLQKGADVSAQDSTGATPLMYAALFAGPNCLELLLDKGAKPNARNAAGATALLWAIHDLRNVRLLVEHGADVNAASAAGKTPLLLAASYSGSAETVRYLLAHGADPAAKDKAGATAVILAAESGNVAALQLLIEKGVDVNASAGFDFNRIQFGTITPVREETVKERRKTRKGATPLIAAVDQNQVAAAKLLIARGADVKNASGYGFTVLHLAAMTDSAELVRLLLEKGAEVNARDGGDNTPLIVACTTDFVNAEIVRALLDKGADVNVKNKNGQTALDWAAKRGETTIVKMLRQAGASETAAPGAPASAPPVAGNLQPDAATVQRAVEKSIHLLQSSGPQFFDKSGCFSCHHQSLPAMAVSLARSRGFAVDEKIARLQLKTVAAVLSPHRENLLQAINSVPDAPEVTSYALVGMAGEKYPADDLTAALVHDLAQKQRADGSWHNDDNRPPLGYSDISSTALCLRALQLYPIPGRQDEFQQRIERARAWLLAATPKVSEEEAYRLLGLGWAKASGADIQKAAERLLSGQRPDGGWAPLPALPSDAYATGQALVALQQGAQLPTTNSSYQRGARFLLATQLPDGSWHVKTRAMGFQPYFESGFPYGHDQWISSAGTSWAAMALTLTVEPRHVERKTLAARE
ncbi:MAG TPA: ankyrin repeat domain-containing protein [Bryobacterales bacterium]|nr:ankyrin repeat domain-containing protein [Bryobacterales bacterium]